MPAGDKKELKAKFIDAFSESAGKFESYLSLEFGNPSNSLFKAIRIFDPRQIISLPQDIGNYSSVITALNSVGILEEWPIYVNMVKSEQLPEEFHIGSYWLNI